MNIVKHKIVTCVFATAALCSGIVAHPQESPVKLIKAYDLDFGDGTQMGIS